MSFLKDYPLRDAYNLVRSINADRVKHGAYPDPDLAAYMHKRVRQELATHPDPLAVPITKGWRTHANSYGIDAYGTDYRILPEDPNDPWTDAELEEYMHDSPVWCGSSRYDFDCTGEKLTWGWHYTRTPVGIVLIHKWYINL